MSTETISEENKVTISYIMERAENIARYSDKLRKSMEDIDVAFTPALKKAGVQYKDTEDIHKANDDHGTIAYRLKITEIGSNWGIFIRKDVPYETEYTYLAFDSVGRIVLKASAKRILKFLEGYCIYLSEIEKEYQEISDKTEKMALSII